MSFKNYTIIWMHRYTTYCCLLTYGPLNQPAITGVFLCKKKVGNPWFRVLTFWYIKVKGKVLLSTGTEALHRPYGPKGE
jgi:hypothetical protein